MTRTVRDIPTEIALGQDEGLPRNCAATFDNLQPIPRCALTERAEHLGAGGRQRLCQALRTIADC